MVRWLATVAAFIGLGLLQAGSAVAQVVTGHASTDAFLSSVFIGSFGEGRIGDRGGLADTEVAIGQQLASPLATAQLDWVSGQTYDWKLSYEPGSIGGMVQFTLAGVPLTMATATPFNSFFIRANAQLPNTNVLVSNLVFGPPPSAGGRRSGAAPRAPAPSGAGRARPRGCASRKRP